MKGYFVRKIGYHNALSIQMFESYELNELLQGRGAGARGGWLAGFTGRSTEY